MKFFAFYFKGDFEKSTFSEILFPNGYAEHTLNEPTPMMSKRKELRPMLSKHKDLMHMLNIRIRIPCVSQHKHKEPKRMLSVCIRNLRLCSAYILLRFLKVHKIEIFFGFDFEICNISLLVMSKY